MAGLVYLRRSADDDRKRPVWAARVDRHKGREACVIGLTLHFGRAPDKITG